MVLNEIKGWDINKIKNIFNFFSISFFFFPLDPPISTDIRHTIISYVRNQGIASVRLVWAFLTCTFKFNHRNRWFAGNHLFVICHRFSSRKILRRKSLTANTVTYYIGYEPLLAGLKKVIRLGPVVKFAVEPWLNYNQKKIMIFVTLYGVR